MVCHKLGVLIDVTKYVGEQENGVIIWNGGLGEIGWYYGRQNVLTSEHSAW